jgi:nucleotide-binding universal stress UspA family protein
LKSAETVTVVTVASEVDQRIRQSLADVMAFLGGHGIEARPKPVEGSDEHLELFQALDESGADLIVSGAYGHSRLREWAFGGVTRSLLDETGRNRFMAS